MLEKIGAAEINAVMRQAADQIDTLVEENNSLREQLAAHDRTKEAEKIASVAVERGLVAEEQAANYAESLASGDRDLSLVSEFLSSTAPDVPLGMAKEAGAESASGDTAEDKFFTSLLDSEYNV